MNDKPDQGPPTPWKMVGVGFELAAAIGGLTLLGYWADSHWDTDPWLTLTGAVLGMSVGCYNAAKQVLKNKP